jgi:hypothetical protein
MRLAHSNVGVGKRLRGFCPGNSTPEAASTLISIFAPGGDHFFLEERFLFEVSRLLIELLPEFRF